MSVEELLKVLSEKNVELWVEGKLLRFRAPENALDASLLASLRKQKGALIKALHGKPARRNGDRNFEPMSIGQQALYFLHCIAPLSPAYNVASAARICSPVDTQAMQQAFEHLLVRHESLRTTFEDHEGQPQRCIHARRKLDFRQIAAADWDQSRLQRAVLEEYQRPFDLRNDTLLRVRLFSVSDAEHVFLMTLHHIVFDAWSLWLLQDEFRLLYQQFTGGETALLPALESRYSDFAAAQQDLQTSEQGKRLWHYWQNRLAGELAPLELPFDRPRVERTRRRGATHRFRVPRELSWKLRDLASAHGATPFMLLLAIFKTWLYRATGQNDLIVGTATSGRKPKFARVVGYFVNTLAIRSDAACASTFLDYLAHVKQRTVEAIDHEEYPFPLLVKRLNPRRHAAWLPICNVMFGLQKPQQFSEVTRLFEEDQGHIDWGGLQVYPFELDQQEGQFDLTFELFETHDTFLGIVKYDPDLFQTSTAARIGQHFIHLADQIAADPRRSLADYDLALSAEQDLVLRFGASHAMPPVDVAHVHGLFERQAELRPEQPAAVCDGQELTYAELNHRANQVARLLQSRGVESGSLVACYLHRGLDVPVVLLAILKAGGVYVPLDTDSPAHRVQHVLRESGAKCLVAIPDLRLLDAPHDGVQLIVQKDFQQAATSFAGSNLNTALPANALAYVMHTSGSTGVPKGVCVSHRAFAQHIASIRTAFGLVATDRMLQFSNLTFDPSLEQMFGPWSLGGTVVLRGNSLWTPEEFWQVVQRQQITVANLPPAYYKQVTDAIDRVEPAESLRLMIVGGDVFPVETLTAWQGLNVRLLNAYGPTEAVVTATVFDVAEFDGRSSRLPIGRPKPGLRAYVLDDYGQHAPLGFAGELFLGGTMLAEGYLHDSGLTAEKFVTDPFVKLPGARMYRTGDRARWTVDGQLEFLGRHDRQIKIHGQRIETGEIEQALDACPGVRASFVQARKDAAGDAFLVAYVVADEDLQQDPRRVREFLCSRLPVSMVPRQFVALPELPINAAGKIDVRALPEPPEIRPAHVKYAPPRTETEKLLVDIWASVLKVESVGVHDNFFDLGGGSLTSLQIIARAREAGLDVNGKPLAPELLFEFPSVGELAAYLQSSHSSVGLVAKGA